jgi:hypothetical protein
LGTVAEVLTMCCFFDKYWRGVGSYRRFFNKYERENIIRLIQSARRNTGIALCRWPEVIKIRADVHSRKTR